MRLELVERQRSVSSKKKDDNQSQYSLFLCSILGVDAGVEFKNSSPRDDIVLIESPGKMK